MWGRRSLCAVENAVTRLYQHVQGDDWVARHWDDFVAIHAPDVVVESRTAGATVYRVRGREQAVAEARSLSDMGLTSVTTEPLAVRGERLAMIRWVNYADETPDGGGPAMVEQVGVVEANEDGQVASVTIFPTAELARAELDRRAEALGDT